MPLKTIFFGPIKQFLVLWVKFIQGQSGRLSVCHPLPQNFCCGKNLDPSIATDVYGLMLSWKSGSIHTHSSYQSINAMEGGVDLINQLPARAPTSVYDWGNLNVHTNWRVWVDAVLKFVSTNLASFVSKTAYMEVLWQISCTEWCIIPLWFSDIFSNKRRHCVVLGPLVALGCLERVRKFLKCFWQFLNFLSIVPLSTNSKLVP